MITKSQVKYIQSLGQKKFRNEEAVFIAEGPKIINELLASKTAQIVHLYATANWVEANQLLLQHYNTLPLTLVKDDELQRLSQLPTPNQAIGIFKKPTTTLLPIHFKQVCLMLDGIQDPGNMGTIIRNADWFGLTTIICSADCADAFAPKVIQSTMGSIARVQVYYTNLLQTIQENSGLTLYAATLQGKNLNDIPKINSGVIVIGNESKGISNNILQVCIEKITIPRRGHAESLNAAVATGIILSHLL